jgi:glycopeptide antibiotics resistance protein
MRTAIAASVALILAILVPWRTIDDQRVSYRMRLSTAFALCVTLILVIVVPWQRFQDHTHWERVQWLPFSRPPMTARDIIANFALYVPVGDLAVRLVPRRAGLWIVAVAAPLLSLGTEATQLFSHGRFPSMTDVTCNVAGAWLGARSAWKQIHRHVIKPG